MVQITSCCSRSMGVAFAVEGLISVGTMVETTKI